MILKRNRYLILTMIILLLAGLACSALGDASVEESPAGSAPEAAVAGDKDEQADVVISSEPAVLSNDLEANLVSIYDRVNPAVVHILIYTSRDDAQPLGSGTGFVYDDQGRIVTNNHVVEGGAVVEVIFYDGSRSRADVIGRDIDSDLAVIDVDTLPAEIEPVVLGDSDSLIIGQMVVAIGNPFGQQSSMAMGIVSGLGRSLDSQRILESGGRYSLPEVVQTDAPINPGNSGGPLLNLQGEVVGVNSAIRSDTGFNSGVGFSIPVNAVRRIVPSLIENGSYTYSFLGVQIRSLNMNLQEQLNLPQVNGAYVIDVTEGGPAEQAGLIPAIASEDGQGGDLIVAIDGQPVADTEQLIAYLVFQTEVGQTVDLTVIRDGEQVIVPLTLGARP